jgi:ComF family protein
MSERGYNQSLVIAKGISKTCGIPVKKNIIKRKRYTNTQTNLSLHERKLNISEAFSVVKPKIVKHKRIVIVDDVITTGATISECAKVLVNEGASEIFAVSVAIADL